MQWLEFELKNFTGIQTAHTNPPKNAALELKNLDLREDTGALALRDGYKKKYAAPSAPSNITSMSFIDWKAFFVPEPSGGNVVNVVIAKGELKPYSHATLTPPSNLDMLLFFIRPYWNGSSWVDSWQWLNECFYGKVLSVDATDKYKINLDIDQDVTDDFNNWAASIIGEDGSGDVYDYGQSLIVRSVYASSLAQIKLSAPQYGLQSGVSAGDITILTKNYIPVYYLNQMAQTVSYSDISYHKILNDLVIGFGSGENRFALQIGYREQVLQLAGFDFGSGDSDYDGQYTVTDATQDANTVIITIGAHTITVDDRVFVSNVSGATEINNTWFTVSAIAATTITVPFTGTLSAYTSGGSVSFPAFIERVGSIDEIILSTYREFRPTAYVNVDSSAGSSSISELSGVVFYITRTLDGFNEYMVGTASGTSFSASTDYTVSPGGMLGDIHKRLTSITMWYADSTVNSDDRLFYFLKRLPVYASSPDEKIWRVDSGGLLYYTTVPDGSSSYDYHTSNNAVTKDTDADATTGWVATPYINSESITLASVNATPSPTNGTYCFKLTTTTGITDQIYLDYYLGGSYPNGKTIRFKFSIYTTAATGSYRVYRGVSHRYNIGGSGSYLSSGRHFNGEYVSITTSTWTDVNVTLTLPNDTYYDSMFIGIDIPITSGQYIAVDQVEFLDENVGILLEDALLREDTDELVSYMNHQRTENTENTYVRSWDQAVVTQGRTYYLNPYIDQSYKNKIITSVIGGSGAFMYNVAPPDNFLDLETFSGDDVVAVSVLPNLDFLILREDSIQRMDSQTGAAREISNSPGVISRRSVVSVKGRVYFAGKYDIYATNGVDIQNITEGRIQDTYRAFTSKDISRAFFDPKNFCYKFFATTASEWVYTERGWVEEDRTVSVYDYAYADGALLFRDGSYNVYESEEDKPDSNASADYGNGIAFEWQSIDFDVDTIGEQFTQTKRFYLSQIFLTYESEDDFSIAIIIDGSTYQTITVPSSSTRFTRRLRMGANGRKFRLKISGTTSSNPPGFELKSVGVLWKPLMTGRYDND